MSRSRRRRSSAWRRSSSRSPADVSTARRSIWRTSRQRRARSRCAPSRVGALLGEAVSDGRDRRRCFRASASTSSRRDDHLRVDVPSWRARRGRRGRSHRGGRAPARLRQLPGRASPVPRRRRSATIRSGSPSKRVRDSAGRSRAARSCGRCRSSPAERVSCASRTRSPRTRRTCAASVLDTLARRAEYNLARMQGNLRLFEIGSVFEPSDGRAADAKNCASARSSWVGGIRRTSPIPSRRSSTRGSTYDRVGREGARPMLIAATSYPGAAGRARRALTTSELLWEIRRRRMNSSAPFDGWRSTRRSGRRRRYGVELSLGVLDVGRRSPRQVSPLIGGSSGARRVRHAVSSAADDAGVGVRSGACSFPTSVRARAGRGRSCGACPESSSNAWNCSTAMLALALKLGIGVSRGG